MSTTRHFDSRDQSIEQVYQVLHVLPGYQREYIWSDDDMPTFAGDIHGEFYGGHAERIVHSDYFIGSIGARLARKRYFSWHPACSVKSVQMPSQWMDGRNGQVRRLMRGSGEWPGLRVPSGSWDRDTVRLRERLNAIACNDEPH